jgi:hypothetical protein
MRYLLNLYLYLIIELHVLWCIDQNTLAAI